MSRLKIWQSGTALFSLLALTTGAAAPLVRPAAAEAQVAQSQIAQAQTQFSDVSSQYWAADFIRELNQRNVIRGFPDGSFRPNDPVTRAQFAAMLRQAFPQSPTRPTANFADVAAGYWAVSAIQDAYRTGFMSGYPGNVFQPEQNIPRAQVLVSLTNGLGYGNQNSVGNTLQVYSDASAIPNWATTSIAAATERNIVVNYPNLELLNPNRAATRAEVAAFIYQALASSGQVARINSPYVVGQASRPTVAQIPAGTRMAVKHQAEKILISQEEPEPVPLTLLLSQDITANGRVLVPVDSQVVGELRLEGNGAKFHAKELVLANGSRLPLNATSDLVTRTQRVNRGANALEIIGGAALGAGAAAAITGLTGDREVELVTVLGGGAAGALAGFFLGRDSVTLVSINPNTDLALTLNSTLAMQ